MRQATPCSLYSASPGIAHVAPAGAGGSWTCLERAAVGQLHFDQAAGFARGMIFSARCRFAMSTS